MQIAAKFASRCPRCGNRIAIGERVDWNRGTAATHLVCPPSVAQPARIAVEDSGVYVMPDNSIVKVKANRERTRTYALKWRIIGGKRLTEIGEVVNGDWEYEAGLVQQVASDGRKMTLDEAKAFAVLHGRCARCNRQLKDARSVLEGLGPVCVKYFA